MRSLGFHKSVNEEYFICDTYVFSQKRKFMNLLASKFNFQFLTRFSSWLIKESICWCTAPRACWSHYTLWKNLWPWYRVGRSINWKRKCFLCQSMRNKWDYPPSFKCCCSTGPRWKCLRSFSRRQNTRDCSCSELSILLLWFHYMITQKPWKFTAI